MRELAARAKSRAHSDGELRFPLPRRRPRPLTDAQQAEAEGRLGFALPSELTLVYQRVMNGGFGPGYGLTGIISGAPDDVGRDVVEDYELRRLPDPDDPTWSWPRGLLAICHWGCAIYSCVDCTTGSDPVVIRFDPNPIDTDWSKAYFPEGRRFSEWLGAWVAGADLWEDGFQRSPFGDAPTPRPDQRDRRQSG